jgi:hypothetical protein
LVLVLTALLVGVGGYIAYRINQAKDVAPEEPAPTLSSCCLCTWELESERGSFSAVFNTEGALENNSCQPLVNLSPNDETSGCSSFDNDYGEWTGNMQDLGTCIDNNTVGALADPPVPGEEAGNVTLTAMFVTFDSDTTVSGFDAYKIEFEYPNEDASPDAIIAETDGDTNLENETEGLQVTTEGTTLPGDQQATLHLLSYETTWNEIIDLTTPGNYKVNFSARYSGEEDWTEIVPESSLEFTLEEERDRQSFCNDLDVSAQGNVSPLDVTLNVDASITQDIEPIFQWNLDLNCDGEIDAETEGENAEQFITTGSGLDEQQITRTFTLPEGQESSSCPVWVDIYLSQEDFEAQSPLPARTENACSREISLQQAPASCGNASCDPNETCDTSGNIDCLEGTKGSPLPAGSTCREDCTFCGDGLLNGNEDCDPNIPQGQHGYNANCQDDCTIAQTQPEQPPQQEEPTQADLDISAISSQECLELVAPNNTTNITISVTNPTSQPQTINAVSNTLPRGFAYVNSSSVVNGNSVADGTDLVVEVSGESQLITWNNAGQGWIIPATATLTINFQATAGPNTQMGEHTNSITVTPANGDPIPNSFTIITAQNCSQPDTGLFDNNALAILFGSTLLLIAGAAYYTGFGSNKVALLMDGLGKIRDDAVLLLTQPQKYMEKRIEKSALKNINEHIKDDQKSKRADKVNNK